MRFLLWGTGQKYRTYRKFFSENTIIALVDNDCTKWGRILDGKIIISPSDINKYEYDYIIIVNNCYEEIRQQIICMNIGLGNVIDEKHCSQFEHVVPQIKYDVLKANAIGKKIAVISHTLSNTGAPIVLKNMVEILVNNHYDVELFSLPGDSLLNDFLDMRVPVTFLPGIYFDEEYCQYLFDKYDLVIVNTLVLHKLVSMLDKFNKKVLWWLHEEEDYVKEAMLENIEFVNNENINIYAVSFRVSGAIHKYFPNVKIGKLPYGIKKNTVIENKKENAKLIIAIIGTVCERKGQEVLYNAVDSYLQDKLEIWMIGEISDKQRKKYEGNKAIKVFGELSHLDVLKLYKSIDAVVCPSLNDPLPVVMAEAMQHKKVCITSDMTGTAEFIIQYRNGIVCRAGDSKDLREALLWLLNNKDKFGTIGEQAFKTYKENFSIDAFEKNILKIVDNMLG